MSGFDSGVKGYVFGSITLRVGFPIDWRGEAHISCTHCQFYSPSSRRCQINKEVVDFPEKYVGDMCPLEIEKTEEE